MRVIALLCLLFGFMAQLLLDGQTFTHAVLGVVLGGIAFLSGRTAAREDPPHKTEGWIMAVLGICLAVFAAATLPGSYRFERQFNDRVRKIRLKKEKEKTANKTPEPSVAPAPQVQR